MVLKGLIFTLSRVKTSIKSFTQGYSFLPKPSLGNVFLRIFLNLRKISEPLLNTMGLRTFVKYHGFKNLHKIPWVKNLRKIPWVKNLH